MWWLHSSINYQSIKYLLMSCVGFLWCFWWLHKGYHVFFWYYRENRDLQFFFFFWRCHRKNLRRFDEVLRDPHSSGALRWYLFVKLMVFHYLCFFTSSPLVQPGHQRFQFSTHEGTDTHRAPGLAQLASQGGMLFALVLQTSVTKVASCGVLKIRITIKKNATNVHSLFLPSDIWDKNCEDFRIIDMFLRILKVD